MSPSSRRSGRAVALVLVIGLLAVLAVLATVLWTGSQGSTHGPIYLSIDGEEVLSGVELAAVSPLQWLFFVAIGSFVLLTVVVAVPLVLLVALFGALLAVLAALGLPLFIILGALVLLLSPLLLLIWLIWRAVRPSPSIAG